MVRKRDVSTGRFYVNKERTIARQVLRISRETVVFNTYHLDTGNSCGTPSEHTLGSFARWASREVPPAKLAILQAPP
jgi:hypothetical protein